MEKKIKRIIASVLETNVENISNNASSETTDGWDSLKQMNIIVALEEEFDIQFDDEETILLNSLSLLTEAVKNKLI